MMATSGTNPTVETTTTKLRDDLTPLIERMIAEPSLVIRVTRYGLPVAVIVSAQAWDGMQGDHK